MSVKRLIFVPTYNERDNAERMVRELMGLGLDASLLFMDDNSPDGTGDILDKLALETSRLSVIHRRAKQGIGSAHLDAVRWAYDHRYDVLITLDCDFSHKPSDVPRLLEALAGHDLATGSRYLEPGSLPDWNILRRSLTAFGHFLTRHLLAIRFDATGALRAYDLRKIPQAAFDPIEARGYGYFFESMYVLIRQGYSIGEFPIVLPARTYGSSKMNLRETLRSGSQLLRLWSRHFARPTGRRALASSVVDSSLFDPQNWDAYWTKKDRPTGKLYDIVANSYRNIVIRKNLERAIFSNYQVGSHLLHAGCGSGGVDSSLHDRVKITAVDISPAAISVYRTNNPTVFEVRHASIFDLPFDSETFDGVYNLGVLEHFTTEEIEHILDELNRVMKPGAKLVVFWPHARATSVVFLKGVHWIMGALMKRPVRLHPPEISLLRSKAWVKEILERCGFILSNYSFGPADFFVQAIVVAEKPAASY